MRMIEYIRIQEQSMTKTVTLRLGEDVYEELREAATAERRPLSNLIETAALARVKRSAVHR